MVITKRELLLRLSVSLAAAPFAATACGGDEDGTRATTAGPAAGPGAGPGGSGGEASAAGGAGGAPAVSDCSEAIAANHPPAEGAHAIPVADVLRGQAMSYGIQGDSAHDHQIALSAAQMQMLAAGQSVVVTSTTTQAHSHDVTVTCA